VTSENDTEAWGVDCEKKYQSLGANYEDEGETVQAHARKRVPLGFSCSATPADRPQAKDVLQFLSW
jgi:hypothetical protein